MDMKKFDLSKTIYNIEKQKQINEKSKNKERYIANKLYNCLKYNPKCDEYIILFQNSKIFENSNIKKYDIVKLIDPNGLWHYNIDLVIEIDSILNCLEDLIDLPKYCECCASCNYSDNRPKPYVFKHMRYICKLCIREHDLIKECDECKIKYCESCGATSRIGNENYCQYCTLNDY